MNRLASNVMLEEKSSLIPTSRAGEEALDSGQICHSLLSDLSVSADDADICSVFAPLHFEADYNYPLLIWLHGRGENEDHLRYVMPKISMRNYAAVAPRGTLPLDDSQNLETCDEYTWSLGNANFSKAVDRVCHAIEYAKSRFRIDASRIFLAGSGRGGTMALQIGMTLPQTFSGIASIGGALPRQGAPLAHLAASRQLPVLLSVNRKNESYPDELVCQDLRLLHIAGMTVTLRQYPAGDALSDSMLSDVDQWMMEVMAEQQQASIIGC